MGYSVQLGKSTDWESFRIIPQEFFLEGKLNEGDDDWHILHTMDETQLVSAGEAWRSDNSQLTNWYPPCNDRTIDSLGCYQPDAEIPCPSDSSCVLIDGEIPTVELDDGTTRSVCNFPSALNPCGPTEFA